MESYDKVVKDSTCVHWKSEEDNSDRWLAFQNRKRDDRSNQKHTCRSRFSPAMPRTSFPDNLWKSPLLDRVRGPCHKTREEAIILWLRIWLRCYHRGLLFWLGATDAGSSLAWLLTLFSKINKSAMLNHVEMSSLTVCIYCQHTWGPTSIIDRSTQSGDKDSLGRHVSRGSSDCLIRYTCSTTDYNVSSATMVTKTERLNEL